MASSSGSIRSRGLDVFFSAASISLILSMALAMDSSIRISVALMGSSLSLCSSRVIWLAKIPSIRRKRLVLRCRPVTGVRRAQSPFCRR